MTENLFSYQKGQLVEDQAMSSLITENRISNNGFSFQAYVRIKFPNSKNSLTMEPIIQWDNGPKVKLPNCIFNLDFFTEESIGLGGMNSLSNSMSSVSVLVTQL